MTGEGGEAEPPSPEPEPAPPAPATPQPVTYVLGLNPCPWEIVNPQERLAKCKAHGINLKRGEWPRKKGKGKVVRYDCPVYCPDDPVNSNERGYCKTGGFINEVFEDAR